MTNYEHQAHRATELTDCELKHTYNNLIIEAHEQIPASSTAVQWLGWLAFEMTERSNHDTFTYTTNT